MKTFHQHPLVKCIKIFHLHKQLRGYPRGSVPSGKSTKGKATTYTASNPQCSSLSLSSVFYGEWEQNVVQQEG
ncbi:hypothetical protein E2C01_054580 [Portunus trituberculatus]|uniref:Uncharacterized protein n=1 Tax=Portunus trituberculatus TaxID=210409 RepID=A0A5B7GP23_PORTR|nr:hypothetical protein [Portunus trituberculatus]